MANHFYGSGRLGGEPTVLRKENKTVAHFSLAISRGKYKTEGGPEADFLQFTAFGKTAEFVEKFLHKGMKIEVSGRIQTGNYTNKDGNKVYTTEVIVQEIEFAEPKKDGSATQSQVVAQPQMAQPQMAQPQGAAIISGISLADGEQSLFSNIK